MRVRWHAYRRRHAALIEAAGFERFMLDRLCLDGEAPMRCEVGRVGEALDRLAELADRARQRSRWSCGSRKGLTMSDWIYRNLIEIDWHRSFNPHVALLDIIMRGTIIYLVLFAILRVSRRHSGEMGTSDVLLIVLIADAVQNGMASDYHSITEGLTLALTIFFWSWLLEWLPVRFPRIRPLLIPAPGVVVRNGRIDWRVLRRELMTEDDLMAQLRLADAHDIARVRRARVEANGQVSVEKRG